MQFSLLSMAMLETKVGDPNSQEAVSFSFPVLPSCASVRQI